MSRKKKQKAPPAPKPWPFVLFLLLLSGFLTYAWGVWYVPGLPKAEIPPYLVQTQDTIPGNASHDTEESPASPVNTGTSVKAPSETRQPSPTGTSAQTNAAPPQNPAVSADPHARRPGVYNMLIAGKDDAALNTDVLLLISYDTEQQTAAAVQIPRDTYCDGAKINALYGRKRSAAARAGSADPTADGMRALCDTIEQVLAVRIDHWILVDTAAFREVVDAVGGVSVNVPCDMDYDDPAQNLAIHLKAGSQRLSGAQAEQFVRFRSDYIRGDLGRVDMQKLFLSALFRQCRDSIPLLSLPAVVTAAIRHVKMDLSFSDIVFFAKSIRRLEPSAVTFMTLPGTDAREFGDSGAWYYILSSPGCAALVDDWLNVYTTPASPHFDPQGRLTNRASPALDKLYHTEITAKTHTAEGLSQNGIRVDTY